MYMLDSDQEPSYNLSKNLLLLPRILKLIEDMVDDSTPLMCSEKILIYEENSYRERVGASCVIIGAEP